MGQDNQDVICPFCGEGDFDLIGIKNHFLRGHCDIYNDTPLVGTPINTAAAILGKAGGKKSRRGITPEQQAKMQAARQKVT